MKTYEIADSMGKVFQIHGVTRFDQGPVRTTFYRGDEPIYDVASFGVHSIRLVESQGTTEYQRGYNDALNSVARFVYEVGTQINKP